MHKLTQLGRVRVEYKFDSDSLSSSMVQQYYISQGAHSSWAIWIPTDASSENPEFIRSSIQWRSPFGHLMQVGAPTFNAQSPYMWYFLYIFYVPFYNWLVPKEFKNIRCHIVILKNLKGIQQLCFIGLLESVIFPS